VQAASAWDSCPRCLAKQRVREPLRFELGWAAKEAAGRSGRLPGVGAPAGPAVIERELQEAG
jgi:hypothetical protein